MPTPWQRRMKAPGAERSLNRSVSKNTPRETEGESASKRERELTRAAVNVNRATLLVPPSQADVRADAQSFVVGCGCNDGARHVSGEIALVVNTAICRQIDFRKLDFCLYNF